MSDNIKVVVKVRPLISREIEDKLSYQWRVKNNTLYQLDSNGKEGQSFTFDKVYDEDTKTSDVYNDIAKPIVEAATAGFNGTIFAYGQTSSGKTYTMTGTDGSLGIIQLAVLNLFEIIKNVPDRDFLVRVSYIEIYNETVKDLLNVDKENIKVQDTPQGIKVDATERVTSSPEEVLQSMKEGEANRQKGATNMNEQSSRSHSIFQIIIESREHIEGEEEAGCVNVSQLNLVDLAGSERSGQTGATGIRFKEGTHINKSLSALALVIKQLSEDPNKYANYRDSKLTRILQNSLGGNAKTSIICAVTPAAVEETISTLQFANRAKAIKNKPEVNAVATDKTMIQSLTKKMCLLQAQLESKKNIEQVNYTLQKQIANLQKLILNGFAQRHSVDLIGGTRRKVQQPRRVTISSLHSIDDDPVVTIPKFRTPTVKYNPMLVSSLEDIVPLPSVGQLASVPEEPARLGTPPRTRAVFFSDEVIELDSDDDSSKDDKQTCSPIHKCYDSKTPPCKLRRDAKLAEEKFKDLVEFTEREKVFTPSVVEYIEKLEQNENVIAELKDQIDLLSKQGEEKDLELDRLKRQIDKTEEDMKNLYLAQMDLKTQCEDYKTKLTDVEVSYETLRNKSKLREEELLSLLEEQINKDKKPENIGKVLSRTLDRDIHFMDDIKDIKDISLVNSENEIDVNANDDDVELVADTPIELNQRNQSVLIMEANVLAYQQRQSLENLNHELQQKLMDYTEKLTHMENENSLLKSTIETLNDTIKGQKENLATANQDIDSYNSTIQELQIQLSKKEMLPKININDKVLENMIANEEQFIANNENIRNIIISFRNALEARNKEIDKLQTILVDQTKLTAINDTLTKQLRAVEQELSSFKDINSELEKINKDNAISIQRLQDEMNKLTLAIANKSSTESELTAQNQQLLKQIQDMKNNDDSLTKHLEVVEQELTSFQNRNNELEKINNESTITTLKMKDEINKLTLALANKSSTDSEIIVQNQKLLKQIDDMKDRIISFEKDILEKDGLIHSLMEDGKELKENLYHAKAVVVKLQHIVGILTGDMREMPKMIDNFVNIFSALSDSINILENVANDIVIQKKESEKTNSNLKIMLEELTFKLYSEHQKLESLNDVVTKSNEENKQLTEDIQIIRNELETKKTENETLRDYLEERIRDINQEKGELLNCIYRKMTDFIINFNIQNDAKEEIENNCSQIYQRILRTLDQIGNHIIFLEQKNVDTDKKISEILIETKKETENLSQKTCYLLEQLHECESRNSQMLCELKAIQDDDQVLNKDLLRSQEILRSVQLQLKIKADELTQMEVKVREWKDQFTQLDCIMKEKMNELKLDNENLKGRIIDSGLKTVITYEHKDYYGVDSQESDINKPPSDLSVCGQISSPPSLVTICYNKLGDFIQPKDIDSKTTTTSSSAEVSVQSDETYTIECKCSQLSTELKTVWEEHSRTIGLLQQMKSVNHNLIQEQEDVRSEIQLLIALAQELQKRIVHHRTNLSILTTTTYAENMSLKSQVKVIQHHLNRFHSVCQRDLPDFKNQLFELMNLLLSIADQQNANFKRFSLPDVLDCSAALPNFKNESTLDGDLLMLDTNITMTTAADNTLSGHDQTCLDLNQYYNDTKELYKKSDQNILDVEVLSPDHHSMYERINILKSENEKIREIAGKCTESTQSVSDSPRSSIKSSDDVNENDKCKKVVEHDQENLSDELKSLKLQLLDIESQKAEIEHKYNNLLLETPSTDKLVQKLSTLEKDCNSKIKEIVMLTQKLKNVQDENDSLSTQVMENITEVDNLNTELSKLKENNSKLLQKCSKLEESIKMLSDKQEPVNAVVTCSECLAKDELIMLMQKRLTLTHKKLNRSLSDSDTTSRYNKICTLQSELHAGREDCKELTEDVVTIKNHLENSSMDLDYSMGESNNETFASDFEINSLQSKKCNMRDIPEEPLLSDNAYVIDKIDCFKFYFEKTGRSKGDLSQGVKIIELMKMFYEYLITEHGKEVENLTNILKDYDESKNNLKLQYNILIEKHSKVTTELEQKDQNYNTVSKALSQIKNNINILNHEINNVTDTDINKLVKIYNENLFKVLDDELGLSSVNIFKYLIDNIIKKHESDLTRIMEANNNLTEDAKTVTKELNSVNKNLVQLKSQLLTKQHEYNLLKAQKEKLHEINNVVTLDIVKKDNELTEAISKLKELEKEKENLELDLNVQKQIVEVKQKEIEELQKRSNKLQEINKCITIDLVDKNNKLQAQQECNEDLNKLYESKVKENETNVDLIEKLTEEIKLIKATIEDKETSIIKLENDLQNEKDVISELLETVKGLKGEVTHLKALHEVITMEKDTYASELIKSGETIKQNNIEMDKMTSDILILKESSRENEIIIEKLNVEVKNLLKDNMELKGQLEEKFKECFRLETNIKTHEKTAEIQTRIITRLEKQKDADDKTLSEKSKQVEELTLKCATLQKQCDMQQTGTGAKEDGELKELKATKEALEARILELEELLDTKSRSLIDAIADSSRKRRQSLHDSKRMFAEDKHNFEDQNNVEAMFASRPKPDDLFMDVEEDVSIRSSPARISKGRESLSLSRTDQSDKDEEHSSRPSSVLAARRRRQSIHDLHRSVLRHTPSPHGLDSSNRIVNELNHSKPSDTSGGNDSELSQLRERLATCQQELEELKEKYRELDDECETCSEYLRERDAQCARLKKEKAALQVTITELKEKINNPSLIQENTSKPTVADVAVNTDEDWTNLHSVVVDRMSFDAEVEKNKRLTKTIEELRYTKQDLKNTIAKMQKALERTNDSRKQDTTKAELQACKQELLQLRERYKDLDEECETCAQYLRDKEEQCRKLKEAKTALETKLQQLQGERITAHSTRKKRQSLHDQNRESPAGDTVRDAATETNDDLLSYQVERDGNFRPSSEDAHIMEIQRLRLTVEKLSHHKAALEQQLASVSATVHVPLPAMYVATGSAIVQNQQLSDVMKENQKLKKMNAKLVSICKKRGKDSNRENEDPANKD